jgi:hypothetical protein
LAVQIGLPCPLAKFEKSLKNLTPRLPGPYYEMASFCNIKKI